jgi:hypothetical protein
LEAEVARRWHRRVAVGLTATLLLAAAPVAVARYGAFASRDLVGVDYLFSVELGRRWLETGTMYLPYQFDEYGIHDVLTTPQTVSAVAGVYPPIAGPFFAIWTVLPAVLWWLVPLAAVGWSIRRAAPWTWPLIGLAACWPNAVSAVVVGNTTMWVAAGAALAVNRGWPALVALMKPSLIPLLVLGANRRSFWIGICVLAVISAPMVTEWMRYVVVIRNAESRGLFYSIHDLPLLVAVVMASVRDWSPVGIAIARFRPVVWSSHATDRVGAERVAQG